MPSMCNSIVGAKVKEGQTKAVEVTYSLENHWSYCRIKKLTTPRSWLIFRKQESACCLLMP